jgi:hypothetical protein
MKTIKVKKSHPDFKKYIEDSNPPNVLSRVMMENSDELVFVYDENDIIIQVITKIDGTKQQSNA